jgi:hypothetical protein
MALTLYSKQYAQRAGSMAIAAMNHGDVDTAMQWLDKAFDKIPDNQDLVYEIGPGGQVKFQIANRATGKISQQSVATPDMIKTVAYQMQTGVAFDEQMSQSIREVGAWMGRTGVQGGKQTEGDIKRGENRAVNAAISRGVQAGHDGDMKGLMDAQQEVFERMGQTEAAVAAVTRMYEDAGVEPPPSLKAYGPKRTGEGEGGTLTERDRKARDVKTKEYRQRITDAEKAGDGGKAAGQAHVEYADFMYQNQKEDASIDKNGILEGMPDEVKEGTPEFSTITKGAYQILRKNPVHAAQAIEFMRAMIAPTGDYRWTEDGRIQAKGISTPLFVSRDVLADIEAWRQANKKAP